MSKKRILIIILFGLGFVGILFFTLRPSYGYNGRLKELPWPMARWINKHDDFCNFLAYALFSLLGFLIRQPKDNATKIFQQNRHWVLFFFLLVFFVEFAQRWIPGRVFDLRDLLTGWTGVLTSWITWRLLQKKQSSLSLEKESSDTVAHL